MFKEIAFSLWILVVQTGDSNELQQVAGVTPFISMAECLRLAQERQEQADAVLYGKDRVQFACERIEWEPSKEIEA